MYIKEFCMYFYAILAYIRLHGWLLIIWAACRGAVRYAYPHFYYLLST